MNIRPMRDQVVVLADPRPEKIGLIYLPEVATVDNPNWFPETGRVLALGREVDDLHVGDRVHFNRFAGKQVTSPDDGVIYLVMRSPEIDMVIDDGHVIFHGYEAPRDEGIRAYDSDPFAGM